MWAGGNGGLESFRDTRPERKVRPTAVVMSSKLARNPVQMPFAEWNQVVEALAQLLERPFGGRVHGHVAVKAADFTENTLGSPRLTPLVKKHP